MTASAAFQLDAFQPDAFQTLVVTGTIFAVDGNDTCQILGTVTGNQPTQIGGDGWTPEEWKRAQALDKKLAAKQRELEKAIKDANAARKQAFKDLIDPQPVAKVKKTKVQSKQEVKADIPLAETQDLERSIRYLETQKNNLLRAAAYRQEATRLKNYLAHLEAERQAELDDEETLLALL